MMLQYFGTLESCGEPVMTLTELGRINHVPASTLGEMVRRYRRDKGVMKRRWSRPDIRKVDAECEAYLVHPKTLQKWSGRTLAMRCLELEKEKSVRITSMLLYMIYRRHNIKLRYCNFRYQQENNSKRSARFTFAQSLFDLVNLTHQPAVVYADESSCNLWTRQTKTWAPPNQTVKIPLNYTRGSSITVIGAIGESLKYPVFTHAKSTNKEAFVSFLGEVRKAFEFPAQTIILVLDNHPVHRSKEAQAEMSRLNIRPMFQPSYSPRMNSIECLWSFYKLKFRQAIVKKEWNVRTQEEFEGLLSQVEQQVTVERMKSAAFHNNRDYLKQVLTEGSNEDDSMFRTLNVSPASSEKAESQPGEMQARDYEDFDALQ